MNIFLPQLLCLAVRAIAAVATTAVLSAQVQAITFEEPGLSGMGNVVGDPVPGGSQLADQFLASHGVRFDSDGGFVAVVVHGAPTSTPPNIIGGTSTSGALDYSVPFAISFFDPNDSAVLGVTDSVQIRGDWYPLGNGSVTMQAYDVDGALLGTVSDTDNQPIGSGPVLAFASPGIHRVVITGSTGTVGYDDLQFNPVDPVATYTTYGAGCVGTFGVPTLAAAAGSKPALGATLTLELNNLPFAVGLMITGLSDSLGGALPLDLSGIGMPGCHLWAELLQTDLVSGAGTAATWSFAVPNDVALLGYRLFNQGVSLDPAANAAGLVVSNAGAAVIGW